MKRYRSYDAYKPSGAEWLGTIPEHWGVTRLKNVAAVLLSNVDKHTVDGEQPVRLCNYVDVYYNERITSAIEFMNASATPQQIRRFELRAGDVLITKDSEEPDDIAVPSFVAENFTGVLCGYHLAIIRPRAALRGAYLARAFAAAGVRDQFCAAAKGITRYGLEGGSIAESVVPLPPVGEQLAIAGFIDRETAKIDALVAKKERFVNSLRAKRDALVTAAVTGGVGAQSRKRESGLPILGAIPEHWEVLRLRTLADGLGVGVVVNPSSYVEDDGLPFLYGSDIEPNRIDVSRVRRISDANSRSLRSSRLHAGDLVMVRVGAPGVTAVVPPELEGANCASLLIIRRSPKFVPQWLCYALNSRYVRTQVEMVQYGAAQEQFNVAHAKNFVVAVPPLSEQRQIVDMLDRELWKLQTLEIRIGQAIAHLRARRTALITAAVTGKIDVRGEAA